MKNTVLNNAENYKMSIDGSEQFLFLKYIGMIHDLFILCTDRISIKHDDYIKHILITGIKNTTYIYKFILLYTNNIELALYHTQKSILYYVEFISQIGDDSQNLLKLNTKDASLFVYKKTIFEINDDYKKTYKETDETITKLKVLEVYTDIYNNILSHVVSNYDLKFNNLEQIQRVVFTKLYKIVEALVQIPGACKKDENTSQNTTHNKLVELSLLLVQINNSYNYKFIRDNYLHLIEYFIKKSHKTIIDVEKIKSKLVSNDEIETIMCGYSVCKIYNYLVSDAK